MSRGNTSMFELPPNHNSPSGSLTCESSLLIVLAMSPY